MAKKKKIGGKKLKHVTGGGEESSVGPDTVSTPYGLMKAEDEEIAVGSIPSAGTGEGDGRLSEEEDQGGGWWRGLSSKKPH